jgi:hypothetical protein
MSGLTFRGPRSFSYSRLSTLNFGTRIALVLGRSSKGLAPQSNSVALGSSPRARRALVVCGLWAGTECRASSDILRRLRRENG